MLYIAFFIAGMAFSLMLLDVLKTLQKESDEEKQKQSDRETYRKGE